MKFKCRAIAVEISLNQLWDSLFFNLDIYFCFNKITYVDIKTVEITMVRRPRRNYETYFN